MPDRFEKKILEEKAVDTEKYSEDNIEKKEKKEIDMESEGVDTREKKIKIDPIASDDIVKSTNKINNKKEKEKKIEEILEEDLEEVFMGMSEERQIKFKKEGENTVKNINILLDQTKINIKKIISLIRGWLSIIPGVNKFFLEQESKIKADEIIELKD